MISNKRGESIGFDVVLAVPLLLFLVMLFLSYVFFANAFVSTKTYVGPVEAKVYSNAILYSKNCFSSYDDELDRVYPGTIELERVNNEIFEKCLNFSTTEKLAAKIEILDGASEKHEAFYNKDRYILWESITGISGAGSATEYVEEGPVLIREKEKNRNGWITISVIIPNSA
ncbi:MAG: hypothetical protein NTV63_02685 [Candidatus Woesearchaeota archaeon]|nr:hypothetical protein [Candidatus Woesearchaeota archaeon]